MNDLIPPLMGAVAMASFVATLFFLKFWRHTKDTLFLCFAIAFAIDAVMRMILALSEVSEEQQPLFYSARLVMYGLIIFAIIGKNRPRKR